MTIKSELIRLTAALHGAQVRHALIGGLAVGFAGVARFTNDIDFLVDADDRDRATAALAPLGYAVWKENAEFVQLQGAIPVDLMLARRPPSKAMLAKAVKEPATGVPVVTVEDLIGLKIQSFVTNRSREHRDKADIQALASVRPLDLVVIRRYADLFGVWSEVSTLLSRVTQ